MMTLTLPHTASLAPTLGLCSSPAPTHPASLSGTKPRQGYPFGSIGNGGSEKDVVCHLCMTQHTWGTVGQASAPLPAKRHPLGLGVLPTLLP